MTRDHRPDERVPSATRAPWSDACTTGTDCTFNQLAPYIGRIKTTIAQHVVLEYTRRDDIIVDPFCGSGVIPFEASTNGRRVIASDINPYGVVLTKAKLSAPSHIETALRRLHARWSESRALLDSQDLRQVPAWVRAFFHPETLRETLALRDVLVARREWFLMGCLLGILHHQRPGFLSFPSSHLVPYLRDKLFSRSKYPEMYQKREVLPRMEAKVRRAFRRPKFASGRWEVRCANARNLNIAPTVNAVVTSPPYMNELDYVRDNRLRLWLLTRRALRSGDIPRRDRVNAFQSLMHNTLSRLAARMTGNGVFVLVVGETSRGSAVIDSATVVNDLFTSVPSLRQFRRIEMIRDRIPDIRRSRRDLRGTKTETILVYRKYRSVNG